MLSCQDRGLPRLQAMTEFRDHVGKRILSCLDKICLHAILNSPYFPRRRRLDSRAVVLAAGFGTRLRPLTEYLPKPLIPLANRPLLAWTMDLLARARVEDLAINLHHLGDMIPAAAEKLKQDSMRISWSNEETILGTGGALVGMREFVERGTFFLLNGDVFSQVDLQKVMEFHRSSGFAATMVVRPLPEHSTFTPLYRDDSGRLVSFKGVELEPRGSKSPCMFCGVHVLEPEILNYLPESGFSCVNDQGYAGMLGDGLDVGTYMYDGPWFDLGTPERYLEASSALLSGTICVQGFDAPENGVLVHPEADVATGAKLGPDVAIGRGCRVASGAVVRSSILLPNTVLGKDAVLDHCIASPELVISV